MNILKEADEIVNNRSQEKERQYGPFNQSMDRMRDIFNGMTGLNLTTEHMFDAMIALKLSRASYSYKEDTMLDLVGYVGAKNNYIQSKGFSEAFTNSYKEDIEDDDEPIDYPIHED